MNKDEIIELSKIHYNGMPEFKAKHFVGNAQITPFAKVRQYLVEIENRQIMLEQNEYEKEKLILEIKKEERKLKHETDDIEVELIKLEIKKKRNNIKSFDKLIHRAVSERDVYVKLIQDIIDSPDGKYEDGRTLLEIMEDPIVTEKLEHQYWTFRMAKQTALDMIAYGRAGLGNMDSVFMLDGEQQQEIIKLATDLFVKNENRTRYFLEKSNVNEKNSLLTQTLQIEK
jgi:hypothetical protein